MEVGPSHPSHESPLQSQPQQPFVPPPSQDQREATSTARRLRRAIPATIAMLVGVALSLALFFEARALDYQRIQFEFDSVGEDIKTVLQSRLTANVDLLRSIASLYASSNEVDREEFTRFTRSTLQGYPGIRGLAWAPRVAPTDVEAFEALAVRRLKVSPGFQVRRPIQAHDMDVYPLTFVEPPEQLTAVLGINLNDYEPFRRVIAGAIDEGRLLGSDPVEFDDPPESFDCLAFLPVYQGGEQPERVEARHAKVRGVAVAMLNFSQLLQSSLEVVNLHGQDLRFIDSTRPGSDRVLYESKGTSSAAATQLRPWQQNFDLAGRQWTLQGIPSEQYLDARRRSSPWGLLAAGLLVTVLVSAYIQSLLVRTARVRELVDVRTAKLAWANEMLEAEVNDRRNMHEALRQSEERNRAVVQQASEGIYLVDVQSHKIIEANPALHKLLGHQPGELKGIPIYECVGDSKENIDERMKRVIASTRPIIGERQYRRRDGTFVDISASATVIQYGGRQVMCTVVHDISERKRAQKLLEEKNEQLAEAALAEREALAAMKSAQSQLVQAEKLAGLGQMVAGVAHEINNPLSFVANNVAVLQRDCAALKQLLETYREADEVIARESADVMDRVRKQAEQIDLGYTLDNLDELLVRSREGLRRIQQIVKDLRDFARLDEGELKEADINAGIQTTANIIHGRAKKRQVQIDLQLADIPPIVCYPAKINQVVMNLLSNAIDASPPNAKVTVTTRANHAGIEIEVADQGSGIPAEIRERIFDPFFTTKPVGEGTGLGLSISYGIITEHGGRIDLESEVGNGTRFTVHLPFIAPVAAPKPCMKKRTSPEPTTP